MEEIVCHGEHIEILFASSSEKPASLDVMNLTTPERSPASSEQLTEAISLDHGYSADPGRVSHFETQLLYT